MATPSHRTPRLRIGQAPQFSLRDLFLLTSGIAGLMAVGTAFGINRLPLLTGMLVASLNACGRFQFAKSKRSRKGFFCLAWLILGISLLVPSVQGCNGSHVYGWQAAVGCAQLGASAVEQVATNWQSDADARSYVQLVNITLLNAANLMLILSPLILWRVQRGRGEWLTAALAITAVPVWAMAIHTGDDLFVGYYLWSSVFTVFLLTLRVRPAVLVIMAILAAVFWSVPWTS